MLNLEDNLKNIESLIGKYIGYYDFDSLELSLDLDCIILNAKIAQTLLLDREFKRCSKRRDK